METPSWTTLHMTLTLRQRIKLLLGWRMTVTDGEARLWHPKIRGVAELIAVRTQRFIWDV